MKERVNEQACEILVLIAYACSESSDKLVHLRSLTRALAACVHTVGM